jgi:class 3 adenylate cyclase
MTEIDRLRRAGGGALRLLVDMMPVDLPPERPGKDEDVETCLIFADVADYSDFVARGGDDAAISVLEILDDVVDRAVAAHPGARVVKRLGDGIMIVTEDPRDALCIASCLVEDFSDGTAALGAPLELRAGVHRGTCRSRGGDFFGYHVNVAARVAASARPGRTMATAHALAGVDLAEQGIQAISAGRLRAKGVTNPVSLFLVERISDHAEALGIHPRRSRSTLVWPLSRVSRRGERRSHAG